MATGIKISALPAADPLTGAEIIPLVQAGATRRTTAGDFASSISNGTLITAAGSTTPRSLAARFADWTNVKDYGALGDGATNDRNAIIAAAAAAGSTGVLFFPSGDYRCGNMNTALVDGQTWMGYGAKLTLGAEISTIIFNATAHHDITFKGLTFQGRGDLTTGSCMAFLDCSFIRFEDCSFVDTKNSAVTFNRCSNSGRVNCQFSNCGFFISSASLAPSFLFYYSVAGGDEAARTAAHHNYVINETMTSGSSGTVSRQSDFIFANNRFVSTGSAGQYFANNRRLVITGNTMTAAGVAADHSDAGNGLDIFNNWEVSVRGNQCFGCGAGGILLANIDGFVCEGNVCTNNWQSKGSAVNQSVHRGGITFDSGGPGGTINAVKNGTLVGNVCSDWQATKTQDYGVYAVPATTMSNLWIDQSNVLAGNFSGEIGPPGTLSAYSIAR